MRSTRSGFLNRRRSMRTSARTTICGLATAVRTMRADLAPNSRARITSHTLLDGCTRAHRRLAAVVSQGAILPTLRWQLGFDPWSLMRRLHLRALLHVARPACVGSGPQWAATRPRVPPALAAHRGRVNRNQRAADPVARWQPQVLSGRALAPYPHTSIEVHEFMSYMYHVEASCNCVSV